MWASGNATVVASRRRLFVKLAGNTIGGVVEHPLVILDRLFGDDVWKPTTYGRTKTRFFMRHLENFVSSSLRVPRAARTARHSARLGGPAQVRAVQELRVPVKS